MLLNMGAGLQAMLYIVAIMRLGSSGLLTQPADDDSLSRMKACLRVLTTHDDEIDAVWLAACRKSFVTLIGDKQRREADELKQLVCPLPLLHSLWTVWHGAGVLGTSSGWRRTSSSSWCVPCPCCASQSRRQRQGQGSWGMGPWGWRRAKACSCLGTACLW